MQANKYILINYFLFKTAKALLVTASTDWYGPQVKSSDVIFQWSCTHICICVLQTLIKKKVHQSPAIEGQERHSPSLPPSRPFSTRKYQVLGPRDQQERPATVGGQSQSLSVPKSETLLPQANGNNVEKVQKTKKLKQTLAHKWFWYFCSQGLIR